MNNIEIVPVNKENLKDYVYVNVNSWNETYRGIMSDDFLDMIMNNIDSNVQRQIDSFDEKLKEEPDYKRFILYELGEAIGMFSICKSSNEKYPNSGEIRAIYLLKKAQKKGYGKLMFERAIEEIKKNNYESMIICCLEKNPTNEFYKHMGGKLVDSINRNIANQDLVENVYYYEKI